MVVPKQTGKQAVMIVIILIAGLVLVEGLLLLKLKSDVNGFANYWKKHNSTSTGEILYIALGDSTAQGLGATSPMRGYVGLTAKALEQKTGKGVKLINLSVSGARIPDVTKVQLPMLSGHNLSSATVTLAIGANDLKKHDRQAFTRNFEELVSQLPKQTVVADIAYFGGGRYRHLEPEVVEMNKVITNLVEKYGLKLAELHKITKERERIGVHSVDWLHPSNKGYKNWAEAFKQPLGL